MIPNTTYEQDGYCVRAKYSQIDEHKLLVFNGQNIGSPSGPFFALPAMLVQEKPLLAPGKLSLYTLPNLATSKNKGDYWVIGLSDIDPESGKYTWSSKSVI